LQTLGPQAIGGTERPVEPPQVVRIAERGYFLHDDIGLGDDHCFHNSSSIKRIGYCRFAPGPTYRIGLNRSAGQAHDGVASRQKQRQKAASDSAARACNEDTHVVCLG